jgi:hypothetical protein
MRYWAFVVVSVAGGVLLINGALDENLPFGARVTLVLGIISLGAGRRMVQQRLHR